MLTTLLDAVLPPRCPACGAVVEEVHRFCLDCWQGLDFLVGDGCASCNRPMEAAGLTCANCLLKPPAHGPVHAAVAYGEVARKSVLKLKYGRRPAVARTLGRLIAAAAPPLPDAVVVAVPLHRWRLWGRGYNQALEIARTIGRQHGLRVNPDLLRRTRATPTLRGLAGRARHDAVRGAFKVTRRLGGEPVWLVDDVFTSGATADACARALRRAGAGTISTLCWARVVERD